MNIYISRYVGQVRVWARLPLHASDFAPSVEKTGQPTPSKSAVRAYHPDFYDELLRPSHPFFSVSKSIILSERWTDCD